MRLFVYTLLRLGLVLAAAGLLYLVGLRSWILWVAAVIVGALVSFLLLGRQRDEAAAVLAQYDPLREERPTFSPKVEADAAYEDAVVDAAERRGPGDDAGSGSAVGQEAPGQPGDEAGQPGRPGGEPDAPGKAGPADDGPRPATR